MFNPIYTLAAIVTVGVVAWIVLALISAGIKFYREVKSATENKSD